MNVSTRSSTSNVIVPEVLTKYNYGEWKIYMKSYLLGEGLWEIVEGVESKPKDPTSPEFKTWRLKNAKAFHAILISCEEEMLSCIQKTDSAKDAWDHLALMSQGRDSPMGEAKMAEDAVPDTRYRALYQAAFWGDWKTTKNLLDDDVSLMTAILLPEWGTVLHVAVSAGHLNFVEKLVDLMTPDIISTITKTCAISALNVAARGGFTKIAELLVRNNIYSLEVPDIKYGLIPVATACRSGHRDTTRYLYAVTIKETLIQGDCKCGATLLNNAIAYEMYDIVIDLLHRFPKLAIAYDYGGWTTIRVLASMPNAFPSGGLYSTWQRLIYSCAPIYNERNISSLEIGDINKDHISIEANRWLNEAFWSALNILGIKSIHSKRRIHVQALKVLKCICSQISTLDKQELQAIGVYDSLFIATKFGIVEIVNELIRINPNLLFIRDKQNQNIFSVAIQYRQERIFNLICGISGILTWLSPSMDNNLQNNILHLAGKSPPEQGKVPGAALQMQRELQWFQEVEKIVPTFAREFPNSKGLKPREVFTEEHTKIVKEGEKWMKDTAGSCMVVATLIATITFAAAFTAPGGFNQDSGFPILLRHKLFYLFIISDALTLFSSSTSVLMFLSIYTSRYAEEDFLDLLPKRLIIGLSTLFFSIVTMMVAFCATLFLILNNQHNWVSIPITFLASVPVTLYLLLQFPLFLDMVCSTYGCGIFSRPKTKTLAW